MNENNLAKKKNIALLLPSLSGGGAERVASELGQFLEREGHKVFVFTEKKQADYSFAGKIVVLKPRKMNGKFGTDVGNLMFLASELKRRKKEYGIDVSISFMEQYNLANVISKRNEKVIIRICTILSARNDLKGFYYNRCVLNRIYNKADEIVVLSQYGKEDMIKNYRIKRSKLTVIPNAVIPREFDKNISWEYNDKVILSVNRIHPIKQQGILIEAFEQVAKILPSAQLVLVGACKNSYAVELKKSVKKRGLEGKVIFVGQVKNVEYYMKHSQVFLLTSRTEGFPNVIVEAMNQGMPIISIDFQGPSRDILGVSKKLGYGKYGVVVPMVNENEKGVEYESKIRYLSNVILKLLTDKKLSEHYSKQSKVRAQYYNKDKIETMWKRII